MRYLGILAAVSLILTVVATAGATSFDAPGFAYTKVIDAGKSICSGAAFSPDGKQIAYVERDNVAGVRNLKLYDRTTGTTTTLTTWPITSGSLTPPYFSADGTKIGWTRSNAAIANDLMVYTISSGTTVTYTAPAGSTADAANSDFLGSSTDQWVAWDWHAAGGEADLLLYSASGGNWAQGANLTSSPNFSEYEPDSNAAGDKILYWSGETAAEPMDTTHTLTNVAGVWTQDVGFTPIAGTTWAFWSLDETQIGLTKVDALPGYGKGDLYLYDASGNFLLDLTGPAVGQGTNWQFFGFNFATGPAGLGREYLFTSDAANTSGGRDVWIAQAVPEPLTMAGLALGIGSLATYLRKRK